MLSKEDYAVIKSLNERAVYLKDIAAELEVHPRTVRRALKRGSAPAKPSHRSLRNGAGETAAERLGRSAGGGRWEVDESAFHCE